MKAPTPDEKREAERIAKSLVARTTDLCSYALDASDSFLVCRVLLATCPPRLPDAYTSRLRELATRLVTAGPKACDVSASECHEISEGLITLIDEVEHWRRVHGARSQGATK